LREIKCRNDEWEIACGGAVFGGFAQAWGLDKIFGELMLAV
jgi:hypothetical protein